MNKTLGTTFTKASRLGCTSVAGLILMTALLSMPRARASALYSDSNFTTYPTGWTVAAPTGTSLSVVSGAPASGSDTNSLNFVDNSATNLASAKVGINGGSSYTGSLTLSFDINMNMVMQDASTNYYNQVFMRLYDGSGTTNSAHTAVGLLFYRSAGAGASTSKLTFANASGVSSGYFNPDSWYHVEINLSAIGGGTTSTSTITGLDGAKVYNTSSTEVSSLSITQSLGASVTDFASLYLASGSAGTYYSNAYISNINAVPEPATALSVLAGMGLLLVARRKKF